MSWEDRTVMDYFYDRVIEYSSVAKMGPHATPAKCNSFCIFISKHYFFSNTGGNRSNMMNGREVKGKVG